MNVKKIHNWAWNLATRIVKSALYSYKPKRTGPSEWIITKPRVDKIGSAQMKYYIWWTCPICEENLDSVEEYHEHLLECEPVEGDKIGDNK